MKTAFIILAVTIFSTLAVVTAVETITRPTAPAIETRADRRKRMR